MQTVMWRQQQAESRSWLTGGRKQRRDMLWLSECLSYSNSTSQSLNPVEPPQVILPLSLFVCYSLISSLSLSLFVTASFPPSLSVFVTASFPPSLSLSPHLLQPLPLSVYALSFSLLLCICYNLYSISLSFMKGIIKNNGKIIYQSWPPEHLKSTNRIQI